MTFHLDDARLRCPYDSARLTVDRDARVLACAECGYREPTSVSRQPVVAPGQVAELAAQVRAIAAAGQALPQRRLPPLRSPSCRRRAHEACRVLNCECRCGHPHRRSDDRGGAVAS